MLLYTVPLIFFLLGTVTGAPTHGESTFIQNYELETDSSFRRTADPHRLFRILHKLLSIVAFTMANSLGLNQQAEPGYSDSYY